MMRSSETDSMLKQVMSDILVLQNDELEIVSVLIEKIKASRPHAQHKTPRASVSAIRAEAKRRAAALGNVPRAELAARLVKVVDEIRAEAIAKGAAIEGEWKGD